MENLVGNRVKYISFQKQFNNKKLVISTTTRIGGFSTGKYLSFNTAYHNKDNPKKVLANRKVLYNYLSLPSYPQLMNQTHSNKILKIDNKVKQNDWLFQKGTVDCDGIYTEKHPTVLGILTADCVPVIIYNYMTDTLAAIHCGWRGIYNSIFTKAIELVANKKFYEDTFVYLGISISGDYYQVSKNLIDKFLKKFDYINQDYFTLQKNNNYYLDLKKLLLKIAIEKYNIGDFYLTKYCTYKNNNLFYSYRKERVTGRILTLSYIKN